MADDAHKPRLFSPGEANAIFARAVERQAAASGGLTHAELVDAGRQAGISADAIQAAIADMEPDAAGSSAPTRAAPAPMGTPGIESTAAELRVWKQRRRFVIHFSAFVMVNLLLAFLNWLSWRDGDHTPWFLIPMLAWGIGLATHFMSLLYGHFLPDPRERAAVRARVAPQVRIAVSASGEAEEVHDAAAGRSTPVERRRAGE